MEKISVVTTQTPGLEEFQAESERRVPKAIDPFVNRNGRKAIRRRKQSRNKSDSSDSGILNFRDLIKEEYQYCELQSEREAFKDNADDDRS